jgi:hypothetical protein
MPWLWLACFMGNKTDWQKMKKQETRGKLYLR